MKGILLFSLAFLVFTVDASAQEEGFEQVRSGLLTEIDKARNDCVEKCKEALVEAVKEGNFERVTGLARALAGFESEGKALREPEFEGFYEEFQLAVIGLVRKAENKLESLFKDASTDGSIKAGEILKMKRELLKLIPELEASGQNADEQRNVADKISKGVLEKYRKLYLEKLKAARKESTDAKRGTALASIMESVNDKLSTETIYSWRFKVVDVAESGQNQFGEGFTSGFNFKIKSVDDWKPWGTPDFLRFPATEGIRNTDPRQDMPVMSRDEALKIEPGTEFEVRGKLRFETIPSPDAITMGGVVRRYDGPSRDFYFLRENEGFACILVDIEIQRIDKASDK